MLNIYFTYIVRCKDVSVKLYTYFTFTKIKLSEYVLYFN